MELIFRDDAYARSCTAAVTSVDERGIRLDRTVFYANSGGQPGDTGVLRWAGGAVTIVDTVKGDAGPDDIIHVPAEGSALPAPGTPVEAEIDWERRHRHMRMHTLLHLVCAVVPGSITGAQIGLERSRVDFNVPTESLNKDSIAAAITRLVENDTPVTPRWITDEELAAQPDLVRTMTVKPPSGYGRVRLLDIEGVDLQPCGGTHVARTGEIGAVEVVKIENKGKQNRRVVVALKN